MTGASVLSNEGREFLEEPLQVPGVVDRGERLAAERLLEEVGELAGNISRGGPIDDDIGDIIVVLINIAERNNLTIGECLEVAYDDIKHRKGKMVDGVFVKESDLSQAE